MSNSDPFVVVSKVALPEGLSPEAFGRALGAFDNWEWDDGEDTSALVIAIYHALKSGGALP